MADSPTYVFDEEGKAYAYVDGKVVASSHDLDELEHKLAAPPLPPGPGGPSAGPAGGPSAGPAGPPMDDLHDAEPDAGPDKGMKVVFEGELRPAGGGDDEGPEGGDPLPGADADTLPGDDLPPRATHIVTPSGLKGTILGKTKGLWSDQVTIRLENGRIAKFDVAPDSKIAYTTEEKVASSPYARMQAVLDAEIDPTKAGLKRRIAELRNLKDEARAAFRTAKYVDDTTLHNIFVEADAQTHEVVDALAAMEDAEPFAPPEPQVFEQESVGGGDSTWLDGTLQEMIQEAEATDFDQEMAETPEVLTAELETPALHDAEGVQNYALAYVRSKTAGIERDAVQQFTAAFLARVEECRKVELATREEDGQRIAKEASAEDFDGPAEGLFF